MKGSEIIYTLLIGKIAEQKAIRTPKLTNADIAKMTGYKKTTIESFMCGDRQTENVANAIAAALGIER